MTNIKIGIASYEEIKARTMAIARGEITVKPDDPKIWFPSIKSFASVFSEENRALLKVISNHHPESLAELERLTGRRVNNLSRTLKLMARYGCVRLEKGKSNGGRAPIKPETLVDSIEMSLNLA